MKTGISITFIIFLSLFTFLSCGKNVTSSDDSINPLDLTPRENEEAEMAALFLSDDLVAPQDLYKRFLHGFGLLRDTYSDTFPAVKIPFRTPFSPNFIRLNVTDSVAQLLRDGKYDAWDSLNAYYGFEIIDTLALSWGDFHVWMFSGKRFNTYKISQYYKQLPGVVWSNAGWYGVEGSLTHPRIDNTGQLAFLVDSAWGDCPSGCMYHHFYYFKMNAGNIEYIGDWRYDDYSLTPPNWFEEVKDYWKIYYFYPDYQ